MNTFDRINYLLKANHKKQIDLTNFLGVKKTLYNDWKTGKTKSYNKYLQQIATFFNVSVDYLCGKTNDTSITTNDELLSAIITYYQQCDMTGKADIYQYAKTRAEQHKLERKDS